MSRLRVWAIAALLTIASHARGTLTPGLYSIAYDMNMMVEWYTGENEKCQGRFLTHAPAGQVTLATAPGNLNPPLWRLEVVKGKPNQVTLMAAGPDTPAGKYLSYKHKACGDASVYLGTRTAWAFPFVTSDELDYQFIYSPMSPVDRKACSGTKTPLLLAPCPAHRPASGSCSPPFAGVALDLNSTAGERAHRWLLLPYTGTSPKPLYGDRTPWAVDKFGASVAAGAEDMVAAGENGGAYVFYKKGYMWRRRVLDVGPDDGVGRVVAAAKNYVAVARPGNTTAVRIYARPWATARPDAALNPPKGASRASFGYSADMNDAFLVIGDPEGGPKRKGAVFVSQLTGSKWGTFTALPGPMGLLAGNVSRFGSSVTLSGATLAVTSFESYRNGTAYVYVWDRTKGWGLQAQVKTPYWLSGVGLSGNTLVPVGRDAKENETVIYRRNGTQWVPDATISSPNCNNNDNPVSCGFASAALRDENTLVLLRSADPRENVPYYGGVYVRDLKTGKWIMKQSLTHVETGWDLWGRAAAVSGKTLVVGAAGTDGEVRRRQQLLGAWAPYYNWIPGVADVYKLKV